MLASVCFPLLLWSACICELTDGIACRVLCMASPCSVSSSAGSNDPSLRRVAHGGSFRGKQAMVAQWWRWEAPSANFLSLLGLSQYSIMWSFILICMINIYIEFPASTELSCRWIWCRKGEKPWVLGAVYKMFSFLREEENSAKTKSLLLKRLKVCLWMVCLLIIDLQVSNIQCFSHP